MSLGKVNSGVDGVAGNTLTADDATFNGGAGFTGLEGYTIRMLNGVRGVITSVTSPTVATLSGNADRAEPFQTFYILREDDNKLEPEAATLFPGSDALDETFSPLSGPYVDGDPNGRWEDGPYIDQQAEAGRVCQFTLGNATSLEYTKPDGSAGTLTASGQFISATDAVQVYGPFLETWTGKIELVTQACVGLNLYWTTGETATVLCMLNGFFYVSSDKPIPLGIVAENINAYKTFTDEAYIDRYQNRIIHSLADQPRRFGATYPASISPQSDTITFDYPVRSIPLGGGQVTLTGMASGNLTVNGIYYDGLRMLVGEKAIRNFYAAVLAELVAAQAAEANATTVVTSTSSTLVTAEAALVSANEALASQPTADELTAASAAAAASGNAEAIAAAATAYTTFTEAHAAAGAASAAADAARTAKITADSALTTAIEARELAETKSLETEEIELQLSDSLSTVSRLEDLQHDGSAILKAVSMRNLVVIFTETAIFIGRYIPTSGTFTYQVIEIPEDRALFYRNTPILVNGLYVMYAAESQFCRFDLTNQVPVDIPILEGCADIFFNQADPEDMEQIFSMDSPITSDIFICFPSDSEDKAIRLDYTYETAATISASYTAGAGVIFPGTSKSVFVMGTSDGNVLRYGLVAGGPKLMTGNASKTGTTITAINPVFTDIHVGQTVRFANGLRFGIVKLLSPSSVEVTGSGNVTAQAFYIEPACFHRRGAGYTSILQGGGDAFKNESAEKKMSRYSVMLSSFSPDTPFNLTFRSGRNINEMADRFSTDVTPPETLVPVILSDYFLSDRIEVEGINNPFEITGRTFHVSGVSTNSFGRRVVQ